VSAAEFAGSKHSDADAGATGAGDAVRIGPSGVDVRSRTTVVISPAAKVELAASAIEANAATFVADTAVASPTSCSARRWSPTAS
jgi:hypothetical protein